MRASSISLQSSDSSAALGPIRRKKHGGGQVTATGSRPVEGERELLAARVLGLDPRRTLDHAVTWPLGRWQGGFVGGATRNRALEGAFGELVGDLGVQTIDRSTVRRISRQDVFDARDRAPLAFFLA